MCYCADLRFVCEYGCKSELTLLTKCNKEKKDYVGDDDED